MTLTEEQLKDALFEQREYMEGLIVKSHDGRMGSMSELFRDLSRRLNERMDTQDDKIVGIEQTLKLFNDSVNAGKLSYWFLIKIIALLSAIGGFILMIKQVLK